MKYKIALITPVNKFDYLTETVIDGLLALEKDRVEFFVSSKKYPSINPQYTDHLLNDEDFKKFTHDADLIFLMWGKDSTDFNLANEVGKWDKTVFIDGSELAKNRRYNKEIAKAVIEGVWVDNGKIDKEMLEKCALYFRREKPYIHGIIPLPFGIESRYSKFFSPAVKKDIDFVCIFGQEEHPPLRKEVREYLGKYCQENGLNCVTQKTKNQDEFYKLLARAKVGVSVGGGGYDTARFWEILANNCLLVTENIDIYELNSQELNFRRIKQFGNLDEFKLRIDEMAEYLKSGYKETDLEGEYQEILRRHSSGARVETILNSARAKKLIE